jgi:hypothetical protein
VFKSDSAEFHSIARYPIAGIHTDFRLLKNRSMGTLPQQLPGMGAHALTSRDMDKMLIKVCVLLAVFLPGKSANWIPTRFDP